MGTDTSTYNPNAADASLGGPPDNVSQGVTNLFQLLKNGYQALQGVTEGVNNAYAAPQQRTQPQAQSQQNIAMTPADTIAGDEAEKSLRNKLGDMYDTMPVQTLGDLVNNHMMQSGMGAGANSMSPVEGQSSQSTPVPTSTSSPLANQNPDSLFGKVFNINPHKSDGTPQDLGIVPNILQFFAKGQFANSNETNAAASQMLQQIQGKQPIQPMQQEELGIRKQEVGVAKVTAKREALSKSLEMINEHKSKLLEQFNAEKGTKSFWGSLGANITGQGQQLTPKQIGIQAELSQGKAYEDDLKAQLAALGGSANPELDSLLQEKARRSKQ